MDHYNSVRLNSATGYIPPKDMLAGRQQEIHAERDRKVEAARKQQQIRPPASRLTFSSRLWGVVLDGFIRTSPRVRSVNFRFADGPRGTSQNTGPSGRHQ